MRMMVYMDKYIFGLIEYNTNKFIYYNIYNII